MSLENWLAFCLLEVLLCLSPGPAVIFISGTAVQKGLGTAFVCIGGILLSNVMLFLLSGTGLAALLIASGGLYKALQIVGGLYLVWLGARLLLAGRKPAETPPQEASGRAAPLLQGFLVQSSNPKALVYFVALLPQFIEPEASLALQLAILTASSLLIESTVLGLYAWLAHRSRHLAGGRGSGLIGRAAGLFMAFIGLRLAIFQ